MQLLLAEAFSRLRVRAVTSGTYRCIAFQTDCSPRYEEFEQ
jgi:hypothetical protein